MHSNAVGLEVIEPWPDLVSLRAVVACALETPVDTILRNDMVDTLLVPVEVVFGTEPLYARAPRFLTDKRFAMSLLVLPEGS